MKKSPKKILIKIMMFIFIINIFSVTYAAYQFVKTYVIDNGYLYQNADGMTVKEFKEQNNIPDIQIYNQAGELLGDSDKISTGDTFEQDGEQNTIVLRGDLNGDGSIDENDFIAIKEHAIEKNVLQNEYEVSADLDENDEINLIDVLLFKRIKSNQEEVKVEGITLDKSNCNLFVGDETTISAIVLPENASNKNVVWSSSNPEIASVNEEGIVTALNPGNTVITATTEDGGYTAECEIDVLERKVESIEIIEEPIKTTYIQNYEELDVTGGKIRLTYNDGTTEEIDMTKEMVSGFDNTTLGPQTLTVTYEGNTAIFEVTIIEKELVSIEIAQQPNKTTYIQNYEELDVTGGKIRLTYNDGTTEEIDMTKEMASGFDNTIVGPQTLTVTYEGKTATFEVTIIEKELVSIEIAQQPNKTAYIQNYEELDVTGGKIRLTYNDGTTEEIDMTEDMVTGFDNTQLGPQTLTVSYEGKTTTFEIAILTKALNKIEISQMPNKVTYIQNYEELDVTGGKIKLTYSDATTEEMDMTLGMVTGFDNTELGSKTLTVTYGGKSANFEITIVAKELVRIEIAQQPNKTTYIQNYEELDITGGKIRLIYNDETTEEIDMTEDMVSGFDNATLGSQTLTVTYEGETATFEITIEEKALEKIEISAEPNKKTYIQNYEELDVTGGKIRLIYNDKTTEEIDMTKEMVSGFDNREVGLQTLTVTYREKTATFGITIVKKELEKIEIIAEPNKKTYIQNSEELDITGGKIRLTYNDETTEEIDMAKEMVTGFDNTEPGPKTLTVTYGGKTVTFEITVVAKELVSIEIAQQPNKKTYIQNYEELDVTGGKIRLIYNDETTEEINMTTGMVSGFSNTTLGPKTLTVSYGEQQATFEVTIVAKELVSIEIAQQPTKKTYIQNYEALDVTGGKIRLIYNDETTEEINMTTGMVTGFSNATLGPKTLTVTYEEKQATFQVTIVAKGLVSIEIAQQPAKTTYIQNYEELNVTGGKIRLIYNDETTEEIDMTTGMVTGFSNATLGPKTLTVTYGEQQATFQVTIVAKELVSIEIAQQPNKTTYIQNHEALDVTGGKIRLIYNDETIEEINMTTGMVSGFNNSTLGPQTLTVTYEGKKATFEVTIVEERTARLDKTDIVLNAGEETTLTIITTPDNVERSYTSRVENSTVAKLEKTGTFGVLKLTGLAKGTTKITFVVTVDGIEIPLECNVTVNAPDIPVTGITLDKTEITLEKGQTGTITANIEPENATNKQFSWSSDNADVINLVSSENGTLTIEALAKGEATIIATTADGNHTASCKVTVTETATGEISMKLDKTNETIAKAETIDITAIMTGMNQNINWTSSNTVIAKITKTQDNMITVTGAQAGKATITATTEDGNYTSTCEINVVYPVTGVTLTEETETVTVGSKTLLTSVLEPINATNQNIIWTSSNDTIATVNEDGIVEGLESGNTTITATTEDGRYQATCEVTVENKQAETDSSRFSYTSKGKKVTITGYKAKGNDGSNLVIPAEIDGMTVETIGGGSKISGLDKITYIQLPDTVKTIGTSAFYGYTNLVNIDLKNVETIGSSAFYNCTGLEKITLPDTLTSIGGYAFYNCTGLNCNLIIPDSVTTIDGAYAFRGCTSLNKVKLSKNCANLPYGTFFGSSLTGPLEIPEGVEIIDGYCFGDTKITSVKFADTVEYIYENAFRQCSSKMEGEIVLPKNLVYWGDGQFDHARNCTNTTIVIPKTLKTIGGDQNISSIYQKKNTGYGTHSFYDFAIKSFTEFIVEEGNQYFQAIDGVLFSKDTKRLVAFPAAKILENGIYEMPEGVEQIDELSFSLAGLSGYSSGNLRTVVLPSTFTISEYGPDNLNCSVGNKDRGICFNTLSSGFYIYNGIREVIVSEDNPDYKSIDGCVYSKDGSTLWFVPLQKSGDLKIAEGTTKIGHGAFYGSYSSCPMPLSSLYIPSTVKDIDQYTLEYMNLLPSRCVITVDENNPYWTVDSNGNVVEK